jgi:hypothetical protein
MVKEIQLTQGQVTQVDNEDFEWLSIYSWQANLNPNYAGECKFIARGRVKGKLTAMHRLIMSNVVGRKLTRWEFVDHIDGHPLNNQRENLRLTTPAQSNMNRGLFSTNTSGYKGVTRYSRYNKWCAQTKIGGKHINLGYFDTPEEASAVYQKAVETIQGEYRRK